MDWEELSPPPDRERRRTRAPLPSRPRRGVGPDSDLAAVRRKVERTVRERPLPATVVALAAGFLLGKLMS